MNQNIWYSLWKHVSVFYISCGKVSLCFSILWLIFLAFHKSNRNPSGRLRNTQIDYTIPIYDPLIFTPWAWQNMHTLWVTGGTFCFILAGPDFHPVLDHWDHRQREEEGKCWWKCRQKYINRKSLRIFNLSTGEWIFWSWCLQWEWWHRASDWSYICYNFKTVCLFRFKFTIFFTALINNLRYSSLSIGLDYIILSSMSLCLLQIKKKILWSLSLCTSLEENDKGGINSTWSHLREP